MLKEFYRRFQIGFIFISLLLLAACQSDRQSSITMGLQVNTPMLVNFPLTASAENYSFAANPNAPTQITLYPLTANLIYAAEVHDNQGNIIASMNSLPNAVLTIAAGTGLYEIAIKSQDTTSAGMLSVLVGGLSGGAAPAAAAYTVPNTPVPNVKFVSFAPASGSCSVQSASGGNVNIRNGPSMNAAIIGALAGGSSIAAVGRSDSDWYEVNQNGQVGWISGSVVTVRGVCNGLAPAAPTSPPPIPSPIPTLAPLDLNTFRLDVDRDGAANISENLAYSDAIRRDLILVSVDNLPSDSYREFALTVICSGSGMENIRWGAPDRPTFGCGYSVVMPFTSAYSQQAIAVTLPDSAAPSLVTYTLLASKH